MRNKSSCAGALTEIFWAGSSFDDHDLGGVNIFQYRTVAQDILAPARLNAAPAGMRVFRVFPGFPVGPLITGLQHPGKVP